MKTNHHIALDQIAHVNKELGIEWVNRATAYLDRVERLEAIDDRFVQAVSNSNSLYIFPGKPRITYTRARRVTRKDAKKKKIQDNDKKDGK